MPVVNEIWNELGDFVVQKRRSLGMPNQQALANAAGVSLSTVARLEAGRPMARRSRTWPKLEKALELEDGFFEGFLGREIERRGYLIEAADVREIEPRARRVIKDALMATLPDVKVSQVVAAENAIIQALRQKGFLPPRE